MAFFLVQTVTSNTTLLCVVVVDYISFQNIESPTQTTRHQLSTRMGSLSSTRSNLMVQLYFAKLSTLTSLNPFQRQRGKKLSLSSYHGLISFMICHLPRKLPYLENALRSISLLKTHGLFAKLILISLFFNPNISLTGQQIHKPILVAVLFFYSLVVRLLPLFPPTVSL